MIKRVILISLSLLIGLIFIKNFSLPVTKEELFGKYVNTNFNNTSCCVEAPHIADTLILKANKSFYSDYYGSGHWNFDGSTLELIYSENNKQASFKTTIEKRFFEEPRIILNWDLDHYYKKSN